MNLSDEDLERLYPDLEKNLNNLVEECAEVIVEARKCDRFGLENFHPDDPNKITNKERLENELGDLFAMIGILTANKTVKTFNIFSRADIKQGEMLEWYNTEKINK